MDVNLEVLSKLYLGLITPTLDLSHQPIRLMTGRAESRPCTVCDVINISAQRELCHLTFVGARNLSNHAKASSKPLFANLKILDVFSIYAVQVSSFMYIYHNDALPIYFTQNFNTGNQIHQYSTRYSDFYRPHTCRTNIKKISILLQGPRIWNSFPNNIRNARLLIYTSV